MTDSFRRAWNRVMAVFRRGPGSIADLDAEIAVPPGRSDEENLRLGMAPEEARRRALVRFGGVAQAREQHREARGLPALDPSIRTCASACVRCGATVRLPASSSWCWPWESARTWRFSAWSTPSCCARLLSAIRTSWSGSRPTAARADSPSRPTRSPHSRNSGAHNRSFQDVTSYQTFFNSIQYKLTGEGDPLPIVGVQVAENFFPMLGVEPALGRLFTAEECRKGGRAAALLSHHVLAAPVRRGPVYRRSDDHHQRRARRHHRTGTVVGVLPAFRFRLGLSPGMQVDFFVPAYMDFWRTWGNTLAVVGRLKPGVSLGQAQAESDILFPQLRAAHRDWSRTTSPRSPAYRTG